MDTDITPISEQAAHWWITLHDDTCTTAQRREFADWIAKSPERIEAYFRVTLLHKALDQGSVQWPKTSADQLIEEARRAPTELLSHSNSSPLPLAGEGRVRALRLFPVALAASLLLAVLSAWFFFTGPQSYRTDVGEQRSVLLNDGSRITLNTSSEIEVDLTKDHRLIRLTQGEALFQVAHDANRPFDVRAGTATIRAVGTQFNVDRRAARTTVTVLEGRVLVDQIPVVAAERVIVTASKVSAPERVVNVEPVTAWTQRRLVFERRALGEVAEEFNRYNRQQIRIEDAELQRQEVTGVFEANDSASFVTFLKEIPDVQINESADGTRVVTVGGPN